jgi:hypothetical protein
VLADVLLDAAEVAIAIVANDRGEERILAGLVAADESAASLLALPRTLALPLLAHV